MSHALSSIELTIVYQRVENEWFQAGITELPGVITAAASRDQARNAVLDALRVYLLASRDTQPELEGERERVVLTVTD